MIWKAEIIGPDCETNSPDPPVVVMPDSDTVMPIAVEDTIFMTDSIIIQAFIPGRYDRCGISATLHMVREREGIAAPVCTHCPDQVNRTEKTGS